MARHKNDLTGFQPLPTEYGRLLGRCRGLRTHLRRLTARFHLNRSHLLLLWDHYLRRRYRGRR